jgi:hypothetical protein
MFDQEKAIKLRDARAMTLKKLGERMNPDNPVAVTGVNHALRHQYGPKGPTLQTLIYLSRAFDCSIYDLLDDATLEEHIPALRRTLEHFDNRRRRRRAS